MFLKNVVKMECGQDSFLTDQRGFVKMTGSNNLIVKKNKK